MRLQIVPKSAPDVAWINRQGCADVLETAVPRFVTAKKPFFHFLEKRLTSSTLVTQGFAVVFDSVLEDGEIECDFRVNRAASAIPFEVVVANVRIRRQDVSAQPCWGPFELIDIHIISPVPFCQSPPDRYNRNAQSVRDEQLARHEAAIDALSWSGRYNQDFPVFPRASGEQIRR
jgi:hypothetical protein